MADYGDDHEDDPVVDYGDDAPDDLDDPADEYTAVVDFPQPDDSDVSMASYGDLRDWQFMGIPVEQQGVLDRRRTESYLTYLFALDAEPAGNTPLAEALSELHMRFDALDAEMCLYASRGVTVARGYLIRWTSILDGLASARTELLTGVPVPDLRRSSWERLQEEGEEWTGSSPTAA